LQSKERKGKFGVGEDNPMYLNGIAMYRRHKKSECNRCGSTKLLLVHHIDENRTNNDPTNLETLCRKCHQNHHGIEERRNKKTGRFT
jgi:5-methylcytosine-specific restriction endonuclease McrA